MEQKVLEALACLKVEIRTQEPMKKHTSFKVGGNADVLAIPKNPQQVKELLKCCQAHATPFVVIGNGSNLLVSDTGIRGVVIKMFEGFQDIAVDACTIEAQAGVLLSRLSKIAAKHALCGLAFASGIPGSLGGAVVMNAGAYGGELSHVVTQTTYIDKGGEIHTISGDAHQFSYRHSIFTDMDAIVLSAKLTLNLGCAVSIQNHMDDLSEKRKSKQPLEYPSAGSTFKRPDGHYASQLIDEAGLRGFAIGGVMVSTKHAGFVVNTGDATATDVFNLIQHIQKTVYEKFNVTLQPEVKLLGDFNV